MSEKTPIEVELGKSGLFAWIDEEDTDLLVNNWDTISAGTKKFPSYYAGYRYTINKVTTIHYMHNEVWENMTGLPVPPGFLIDHINGDKLDNRRCNLRLATRQENEANKRKRRADTTSSYKGVSYMAKRKKKPWRAYITLEEKFINLGTYETEIEAARAYNKAAVEHFGEFAFVNDIDGE